MIDQVGAPLDVGGRLDGVSVRILQATGELGEELLPRQHQIGNGRVRELCRVVLPIERPLLQDALVDGQRHLVGLCRQIRARQQGDLLAPLVEVFDDVLKVRHGGPRSIGARQPFGHLRGFVG